MSSAQTQPGPPVRSAEQGSSIRFQFEALTLFAGGFTLYVFFDLLHQAGYVRLVAITLANVAPWAIGLQQWKEAAREEDDQEGSSGNPARKAIVLVLWTTYLALLNIEYFYANR